MKQTVLIAMALLAFTGCGASGGGEEAATAGYDGSEPLSCVINVDCNDLNDVVDKMQTRWAVFSSQTVFSDACLGAIDTVEGFDQIWPHWGSDQRSGAAGNQMQVCNIK